MSEFKPTHLHKTLHVLLQEVETNYFVQGVPASRMQDAAGKRQLFFVDELTPLANVSLAKAASTKTPVVEKPEEHIRHVVRLAFPDTKQTYVYRYVGPHIGNGDYVLVPDRRGTTGFEVSLGRITELLPWDTAASVNVICRVDVGKYLERKEKEIQRGLLIEQAKENAAKYKERNELYATLAEDPASQELLKRIMVLDSELD